MAGMLFPSSVHLASAHLSFTSMKRPDLLFSKGCVSEDAFLAYSE